MAQSTSCRVTGIALIGVLCALVLASCGGSSTGSGGATPNTPYSIAPDARNCDDLQNYPLSNADFKRFADQAIERANKAGARGIKPDAVAIDIREAVNRLCQTGGSDVLPVPKAIEEVAGLLTQASARPPSYDPNAPPSTSEPAPGGETPPASGTPPAETPPEAETPPSGTPARGSECDPDPAIDPQNANNCYYDEGQGRWRIGGAG